MFSFRFDFQMVLNQFTTASPQSDSLMADEAEGSGEGSGDGNGSSRPGWDDDDNADEYSSGDGSGENPITTQVPGAVDPKGKRCLSNRGVISVESSRIHPPPP